MSGYSEGGPLARRGGSGRRCQTVRTFHEPAQRGIGMKGEYRQVVKLAQPGKPKAYLVLNTSSICRLLYRNDQPSR